MIGENELEEKKVNEQEGGIGAMFGSIIIIIIIIIGGWYIWQEAKRISNLPPIEKEITINEVEDIDNILQEDVINIEADLEAIDMEF